MCIQRCDYFSYYNFSLDCLMLQGRGLFNCTTTLSSQYLLLIQGDPVHLLKITIAHCAQRYNLSTSTHYICICASPQRGCVWVRLQPLNVGHSCWMGFCTKPQSYVALLVPHIVVPGPVDTGGSGQSPTWEIHLGLQDLSSQGCIKGGSLVVVHSGCRQEGTRCL